MGRGRSNGGPLGGGASLAATVHNDRGSTLLGQRPGIGSYLGGYRNGLVADLLEVGGGSGCKEGGDLTRTYIKKKSPAEGGGGGGG